MSTRNGRVTTEDFTIEAHGNDGESEITLVAVLFTNVEEERIVGTAAAGVRYPRTPEELPSGVRVKDESKRYPALEFTPGAIAPEVVRIKVVVCARGDAPLLQASFIGRELEGQSYVFDTYVTGVRIITFTRDEAGWSYAIDLPPKTW